MIEKKIRLALARYLKLYKEIGTDKGVLIAEADEIEVGTEVFVQDAETGDLQPALDGEYIGGEGETYKVESGIITAIVAKEATAPEPATETPVENPVETPMAEETPAEPAQEETPAEPQDNVDELKARIDELEKENQELKDKIAEYEEKAKETEQPAEEMEKTHFSKQDEKLNKVISRISKLNK